MQLNLCLSIVSAANVTAIQASYADRSGALAQDPAAAQAYGG